MNTGLKHLKVLYVEDDMVHRQEMADYLSRRVGRLYLAENGAQGLEKYEQLKPDLVLTDLRMPKMTGLEMSQKIREIDKAVPIIIMTALSDKETILEAVKLSILNYVLKPVDVRELIQVMETAVETIAAINQNFGQSYYSKESINTLKKELTAYIKFETGKGPVDIRFEVTEKNLTIYLMGTLTKFENSLLKEDSNRSMVEYNRTIFLKDRIEDITAIVSESVQDSMIDFVNIHVDADTDVCSIQYSK